MEASASPTASAGKKFPRGICRHPAAGIGAAARLLRLAQSYGLVTRWTASRRTRWR